MLPFNGYVMIKNMCKTFNATEKKFRWDLAKICADYCFISPTAVDLEFGVTDTSDNEALVRSMMIKKSKCRILVADHTKFGETCPNIIAPLESFNRIITDKITPEETAESVSDASYDRAREIALKMEKRALNVTYC